MIKVNCPDCQHEFTIKKEYLGKLGNCDQCRSSFTLETGQKSIPLKRFESSLTTVTIIMTLVYGAFLTLTGLWILDEIGGEGWVAIIFCGFCLIVVIALLVPVRFKFSRPKRKRHLIFPIVVIVLLFIALLTGAGMALSELVMEHPESIGEALLILIGPWILGMVLVYIAFFKKPGTVLDRLYIVLFSSTILELLIAVPAHLIVRKRGECCAGILTGSAIAVGIVLAVVVLGPSLFLLIANKVYKRKQYLKELSTAKNDDAKCAQCGSPFDKQQLVFIVDQYCCANCKNTVLQKMREA